MSTNPFRDYAQFAEQIYAEEQQRDISPQRLLRPLGVRQKHVAARETELQRLRAAALAAARKTGHSQSEVERRVAELFVLCERLLLWERDAPRLTAEERRQRDLSPSWTVDPRGDYLSGLLNQFAGPWQQVIDLASAYAGSGQAEGEQTKGSEQRRRKKRGRGKPPLEKCNPLKHQIYERICREHVPRQQYADTVERLKPDKDFVEQVKEAGLTLNTKLVENALAWVRRPGAKEQNR